MKILTTILTCSKTQKRANACLDTWIKDIKPPHDYFFYGDKKQSQSMDKTWNCSPDSGDSRGNLPEKTYKMLNKSLEYDYDFLFKCDDDTYLAFDRLVKLVQSLDPKDDLYIGSAIHNFGVPYAQGGAGYLLTRSAVEKCLHSLELFYQNRSKNRTAEDYSVGLALKMEGVRLQRIPLFNTPNPKRARQNQGICVENILTKNKITTHYVWPETMSSIHINK